MNADSEKILVCVCGFANECLGRVGFFKLRICNRRRYREKFSSNIELIIFLCNDISSSVAVCSKSGEIC